VIRRRMKFAPKIPKEFVKGTDHRLFGVKKM
jgi:hypothetical protein